MTGTSPIGTGTGRGVTIDTAVVIAMMTGTARIALTTGSAMTTEGAGIAMRTEGAGIAMTTEGAGTTTGEVRSSAVLSVVFVSYELLVNTWSCDSQVTTPAAEDGELSAAATGATTTTSEKEIATEKTATKKGTTDVKREVREMILLHFFVMECN